MKKYLWIVLLIFMILITALPVNAENGAEELQAKVVKINKLEEVTQENIPTKKVQNVTVRILEGEYENEEYEMYYIITENVENIIANVELEEDDKVLVTIEEKEGEVTNISYIKTIRSDYNIYISGAILIVALLVIGRKRATIVYLITILLSIFIIAFTIKMGWSLIFISIVLSFIITTITWFKVNGSNRLTIKMIIHAILGIIVVGVLSYLLFDSMNFININIKLSENFVSIKDIICSGVILFSCGIYNSIMISAQYIFYSNNKSYKTKSDNIIEGQRSLKL